MPTANVGSLEIYYEESGRGETVLLVPPSWWPCDTWKVSVVPVLSENYRTIIFDVRGTGRSSKPADGYTVKQFALDCAGLLEHLEVTRCHAVGFALGGQIGQALAIERPDLVATLTMVAVGAGTKTANGSPRQFPNTDQEEIRAHGFEAFIRGHVENTHMAFNPEFFREHPEIVKALSDALWERQTSPELYQHHYDARQTWDTLGSATNIKVPTLILCGADDNVNRRGSTPAGTARKLAELIPGCELKLIPGVKHMTFWDGCGALSALQDFLVRQRMVPLAPGP